MHAKRYEGESHVIYVSVYIQTTVFGTAGTGRRRRKAKFKMAANKLAVEITFERQRIAALFQRLSQHVRPCAT